MAVEQKWVIRDGMPVLESNTKIEGDGIPMLASKNNTSAVSDATKPVSTNVLTTVQPTLPNLDKMNFSKAFAYAFKNKTPGQTTFKWRGTTYGLKRDPEWRTRWGLEEKKPVSNTNVQNNSSAAPTQTLQNQVESNNTIQNDSIKVSPTDSIAITTPLRPVPTKHVTPEDLMYSKPIYPFVYFREHTEPGFKPFVKWPAVDITTTEIVPARSKNTTIQPPKNVKKISPLKFDPRELPFRRTW